MRGTYKQAIYAAHELDHVTLANALELTILAAEVGDERWPKLAARWHCRFVSETPGIGAAESAFALAGVCALGGPLSELAAQTLRHLAARTRTAAVT
jgi:hypothetical protein